MKLPHSLGKLTFQHAVGVFTCGLALTVELLCTIEWSFPNCSDPWNGPSPAIFGAPIPYERWGGSSLEYVFMPHVYLLNVALLMVVVFPFARGFSKVLARRWPQLTYRGLIASGLLLCIGVLGVQVLALGTFWHPVTSIADLPGDSWRELRPIRVTMGRHYHCAPSAISTFWFGSKADAHE